MKVADLFSGVGGLSLGFRQAGFAVAFAIEHDKEIAEAYSRNDSSAVNDTRKYDDSTFKTYCNEGLYEALSCVYLANHSQRSLASQHRSLQIFRCLLFAG